MAIKWKEPIIENGSMDFLNEEETMELSIDLATGVVEVFEFTEDIDIQSLSAYISKAKSEYGKLTRSKEFEDYI